MDRFVVKAYRGYPAKDENGNDVMKQRPVQLAFGSSTQQGNGVNIDLDSLPMVNNGSIERISLFPLDNKGEANGKNNS